VSTRPPLPTPNDADSWEKALGKGVGTGHERCHRPLAQLCEHRRAHLQLGGQTTHAPLLALHLLLTLPVLLRVLLQLAQLRLHRGLHFVDALLPARQPATQHDRRVRACTHKQNAATLLSQSNR
jgi:hypothetical protein